MIYLPSEVIEALKTDSTPKNWRIHFPNGERADITNENLVKESCCFTESTCSSEFKLGVCENPVFECETVGIENIKGKKIEVSLEVLNYSIPIGVFYIDECKRQAELTRRKITAYGINLFKDENSTWFPYVYENSMEGVGSPVSIVEKALPYANACITDEDEMLEKSLPYYSPFDGDQKVFEFGPYINGQGEKAFHDKFVLVPVLHMYNIGIGESPTLYVKCDKEAHETKINSILSDFQTQLDSISTITEDMKRQIYEYIKNLPEVYGENRWDSYSFKPSTSNHNKRMFSTITDEGYLLLTHNTPEFPDLNAKMFQLCGASFQYYHDEEFTYDYASETDTSLLNSNIVRWVFIDKFFECEFRGYTESEFTDEDGNTLYREGYGIDAEEAKEVISAWAELKGKLGKVDRYGRLQYVSPIVSQSRVPLDTLYPADDLLPEFNKARVIPNDMLYPSTVLYPEDNSTCLDLVPSDYSSFWYDDEYSKPFGKVEVNYKDMSNDGAKTYYSLNIAEDYDDNPDNYRVYDLSDNYIIKNYSCYASSIEWACENIKNSLGGLTYISVDIESIGRPDIEAGDAIRVNGFDTVVLRRTLQGIQSLRDNYEAE